MSNMYLEVIEKESIKEHQMDILSENGIRLFLPVTFMESGDGNILSYTDGEGYVKINQIGTISSLDAIDMIGMLADGMKDASNNYIFPEEYDVNEDTIFVNRDLSAIRLAFRPSKKNKRIKDSIKPQNSMENLKSNEGLFELMDVSRIAGKSPDWSGLQVECTGHQEYGGQLKGAPPDPPQYFYRRVRSLADLLSVRVGEDAAGPIWEAARLFRGDGYGPAAALQELAKLRYRIWIKEADKKHRTADSHLK